MSRRFFWLGIAIVAAIGLYTAGWFYAADVLDKEVRTGLAEFGRDGGNRAVCEEATVRGYPFRIGVFCNATYVERASAGFSMSTGAFRSAAQVYAPQHVVAEADSPARVVLPGLVPLDLTWGGLRSSARLAWPLPEQFSMEATDVTAVADMPNVAGPLAFTADRLELHLRPVDADLDVALRFAEFEPGVLLLPKGSLPPLTGYADLSLKDGTTLLRDRRRNLRGSSFTVRRIEIGTQDRVLLTATGTLSVDEAGLIDADLTLETEDGPALARAIMEAFPESGSGVAAAIGTVSFISSSLPLTIRKGQATLAVVYLGAIPPI